MVEVTSEFIKLMINGKVHEIKVSEIVDIYHISFGDSPKLLKDPFLVLIYQNGYLLLNNSITQEVMPALEKGQIPMKKLYHNRSPFGWRGFPFFVNSIKTRVFTGQKGRKRLAVFIKKCQPLKK